MTGVVRTTTLQPIAGAMVRLDSPSNRCWANEAVTGADGVYHLEVDGTLLGGSASATASAAGFVAETQVVSGGLTALPTTNDFSLSR